MYRPSVQKTCEQCGKLFTIFRAWLRNGKGGRFCSRACAAKGRTTKPPTVKIGICQECQMKFRRTLQRAGQMVFCSIQCLAINRGKRMQGSNHPNWKGGITERSYATRKAIARVKHKIISCETCSSSIHLQGHHVIPYTDSPSLGSLESNIKVLCIDCHAKEHPNLRRFILHG